HWRCSSAPARWCRRALSSSRRIARGCAASSCRSPSSSRFSTSRTRTCAKATWAPAARRADVLVYGDHADEVDPHAAIEDLRSRDGESLLVEAGRLVQGLLDAAMQ